MGYRLLYEDKEREFLLYAPEAWPYWLEQVRAMGRPGLPLVLMWHGGGQAPANYLRDWPFDELMNSDDDPENKFFLVVPYGFGVENVPDEEFRDRRSWAVFPGMDPTRDDTGFNLEILSRVMNLLALVLLELGLDPVAVDPDRVHALGYSNGGMMAFKFVHDIAPSEVASMVILASTIGGRMNALAPLVFHDPVNAVGARGISIQIVHGDVDPTIPPDLAAPDAVPIAGGLLASRVNIAGLENAGVPTGVAEDYAAHYYPLQDAVDAYVMYNQVVAGMDVTPIFETGPSVDPAQSSAVTIYGGGDVRLTNPVVVVVRDPAMTHTNITGDIATGAVRWLHVEEVWAFFKAHPRP